MSHRCEFSISTSTGIDGVSSYIFKKPLLVTNITPLRDISQYATSKIFFLLFKEYANIKDNKKLNFSEIKKKNLFSTYRSRDFKKAGIKLIENDKYVILNSVKEMIKLPNKKKNLIAIFFGKNMKKYLEQKNKDYIKKLLPMFLIIF